MPRRPAPDAAIAELAARQGGVVSRSQLRQLGFSANEIEGRRRAARLHTAHRGVYAVGHPRLGAEGKRWAAVLALGRQAVLSHATAAAAWDIRSTGSGVIHVTVPGRAGRKRRAGIRVHRPSAFGTDEVTTLDGLPITTPARTLVDLAAGGLRGRALEAALDRAELLRLVDFAELDRLLRRTPSRRGVRPLQTTLARYVAGTVETRSKLEELVLEICDAHGLERPLVNTRVEGRERDFFWPGAALVVEADSYSWHRSPSALDEDRERDAELVLAGFRTLRFTWEQVTERRDYVAGTLLGALRAR
jgi:predicted transcriptional regulator of viral defense system